MPPKAKAAPPAPPQDDGSAERVLMEKELVIAYMKSKLGRCVRGPGRGWRRLAWGVPCLVACTCGAPACLPPRTRRYQANGDRLQLENIRLNEDLDTQKLNLRDINDFLTNELKARSLTTNALEAKLFDLNLAMEEARKAQEVRARACAGDMRAPTCVMRQARAQRAARALQAPAPASTGVAALQAAWCLRCHVSLR